MRVMIAVLFISILTASRPALSQDQPDFSAAVESILDTYILPAHERFASAASDLDRIIGQFCAAPGTSGLAKSRTGFNTLVTTFAAIEMFRFGPARQNNRFEHLFYWPDRKGRGLKQVQKILATSDSTAASLDTLLVKSVALQGITAAEYLLFGKGYETLLVPGNFRCRYLQAVASAISLRAMRLYAGWEGTNGYAAVMRSAGPENTIYHSSQEAFKDILKAAREQLEITRDLKIGRPLGDSATKAKPKRAPLWRSDATLHMAVANLRAVRTLMTQTGIEHLLDKRNKALGSELSFELSQAERALQEATTRADFQNSATDPDTHNLLTYSLLPMKGALEILTVRYPAALGLSLGFNSLDGD